MAPRLLAGLIVLALVAVPAPSEARTRDLRPFSSCDELLGYARSNASRMVGTGWLPVDGGRGGEVVAGPMPAPQVDAQTEDRSAGMAPGRDFSTTNIQEEGVDEPDVVKTDGRTLFAVTRGVLRVVDVRSAPQRLIASLDLAPGDGHELLVHDDRLLDLQNAWLTDGEGGRPVARLTEVDVSDPAKPRILRTDRVDGSYVTARKTGDMARIVVSSPARGVEPLPAVTGVARRRAVVRRARLSSWRPSALSREHRRRRSARYPLVPCRQVRHPSTFSGLDTTTVLTSDLDRGLPAVDADAVMSDVETVYGSPSRLYVATSRWLPPQIVDDAEPPAVTSRIHAFDVAGRDGTSYVGTGSVRGFLLSQFAMSEHEGHLRVAATERPAWWNGRPPEQESESSVTVLDRDSLTAVGRVGGLGRGEQIFAVRFLGDVGYVVTFRQIDPLYTIDLATPTAPRVVGELKVAGYSAYLHPVGEDLVLGVGQDADEEGRTRGTQLSLFDVSDAAKPTRVAVRALGSASSSAVEFDHRAFLWWPAKSLAVVPVTEQADEQPFAGAVGFGVTRGAIEERGRLSHPFPGQAVAVTRSVVVGEQLFTLSDRGLLAADLTTLAAGSWLPFPGTPDDVPGPRPVEGSRPAG